MADFYLSCCSTVDLTPAWMEKRELKYECFTYTLDGYEYPDDMGVTMSPQELFKRMAAGAQTKTSQVTVERYIAHFESMLQEGKDVLHLTLSSGLSGSYNSACVAAQELQDKYPERKLYIVDSLAAASGYGMFMDTLADMRDAGKTIDELHEWALENRLNLHHWFFSTDLTFFVRGGRISKAAGMAGTVLKICPLLNVDFEGRLVNREKIRGKKLVVKAMFEKMKEHAKDGQDYNDKCFMCHSLCEEDAKSVAALVEEYFPALKGKVEIFSIGTTIGSHTGPGTVALFFWGDKRID